MLSNFINLFSILVIITWLYFFLLRVSGVSFITLFTGGLRRGKRASLIFLCITGLLLIHNVSTGLSSLLLSIIQKKQSAIVLGVGSEAYSERLRFYKQYAIVRNDIQRYTIVKGEYIEKPIVSFNDVYARESLIQNEIDQFEGWQYRKTTGGIAWLLFPLLISFFFIALAYYLKRSPNISTGVAAIRSDAQSASDPYIRFVIKSFKDMVTENKRFSIACMLVIVALLYYPKDSNTSEDNTITAESSKNVFKPGQAMKGKLMELGAYSVSRNQVDRPNINDNAPRTKFIVAVKHVAIVRFEKHLPYPVQLALELDKSDYARLQSQLSIGDAINGVVTDNGQFKWDGV